VHHTAQQWVNAHIQAFHQINLLKLALNGVQSKLGLLKQHQAFGLMANNLPAQLRTN